MCRVEIRREEEESKASPARTARWRLHASSSWIARTMNSRIDLHVTCCVRSEQSNLSTHNRVEVWVRPVPRVEVRLKWKHANSRTGFSQQHLDFPACSAFVQESGREHVVTSKHWRSEDLMMHSKSTIVRSKSFVISRRLKMCSYDFFGVVLRVYLCLLVGV